MMNGPDDSKRIFLSYLALALAAPLPVLSAVTLSPTSLKFGSQVQGTTSTPKTVTLQNSTTAALTITGITVTGNFVRTGGGTCAISPPKLAQGASCTIRIAFKPASLGSLNGTLTVTDNVASSPQTATLSGTGIAPVTVSPASLSFGKLPVGETSPAKNVTLTNNQSSALSFNNIYASGNFAVESNTCGSSIAALASCSARITFSPTTTGSKTGTLSFSDDAANTPQTVSLAGTGTVAALVSIAVTPADPSISVGGTQQLTATGTYSNNSTKDLSSTAAWTTSPAGIASVSTSGLATGLAAGSTTVTAALSGVTGSTTLTVTQSFLQTGSLNTARYYHTATLLDTGLVLLAGGIGPVPGATGALGELASAELYNPATGTFAFTGNLNTARSEHSATLLNSGKVLIAGGSGGDGELASAEVYDSATAAFNYTGSLNTARCQHTATLLPNATVLIAGGWDGGGVLASAELYNPATGKFVVTGSLNAARFGATATLLPNGLVLVAGGADESGALSSAELYNPSTGQFTPAGSLNVARSSATATLLNNGNVLIADGYNYLVTGPLTSAELYVPATGLFNPTGSLASSAWLGTATLLSNGAVLAAGSALNSAAPEIYSPATGTFSAIGGMLTPRDLQTATPLASGNILLAGGFSSAGNAVLASAELYEPSTLAPPNLVSIAITPYNPPLSMGAALQLIATGTLSNNSTQQLVSVAWSSSNPAAATVSNDETNSGVVYGVAAGSTIISACTGAVCGTTPVTVTGP